MNSILFCAFTPVVRKHLSIFFQHTLCLSCQKNSSKVHALKDSPPASTKEMENTTDYDGRDQDQKDQNNIQRLLVNTDPNDSEPRSHLLDSGPVAFNYQSVFTTRKQWPTAMIILSTECSEKPYFVMKCFFGCLIVKINCESLHTRFCDVTYSTLH